MTRIPRQSPTNWNWIAILLSAAIVVVAVATVFWEPPEPRVNHCPKSDLANPWCLE